MGDYRTMFDRTYLGAWDLQGRDVTVTIERVEAGTLKNAQQQTNKKPILFFAGKELGMVCNKTNAKAIASMYGNDVSKWVGQSITLYPTTTSVGGATTECIRVRNVKPSGKKLADAAE